MSEVSGEAHGVDRTDQDQELDSEIREYAANIMEYLAARFRSSGVPVSTVMGELTMYSNMIRRRRDAELKDRRTGAAGDE